METTERALLFNVFGGEKVMVCMTTSAASMTASGTFHACDDQLGFWVGSSLFSLQTKDFYRTEVTADRVYLYYAHATVAIRPVL
jgi:hypothetical protein